MNIDSFYTRKILLQAIITRNIYHDKYLKVELERYTGGEKIS